MSETLLTVLISSIVSLVGSFLVVYVAARRAPAQNKVDESNASEGNARAAVVLNDGLVKRVGRLEEELAEACEALDSERAARQASDLKASDSANRIKVLEEQVTELRGQVGVLSAQRDTCQAEREIFKNERDLFENWAHRLVGQIKSMDPDTVPVAIDSSKRRRS